MSNEKDVHRLIAEVKKRPMLWNANNAEYKERANSRGQWQEIADTLNWTVEQCKRKWKNLRDAYRAELRRHALRLHKAKVNGDSLDNIDIKWVFFESMKFVGDTPKPRKNYMHNGRVYTVGPTGSSSVLPATTTASNSAGEEEEKTNTTTTTTTTTSTSTHHEYSSSPSMHWPAFCDVKTEPHDNDMDMMCSKDEHKQETEDEEEKSQREDEAQSDAENEFEDDMLFEEFQAAATPQAVRRLSNSISMAAACADAEADADVEVEEEDDDDDAVATAASASAAVAHAKMNASKKQKHYNTNETNTTTGPPTCKCSRRADEQVNFLENLEREEQKLMQSTRQDITRYNTLEHIGDSDYNFLVSFLPKMKKMSELQNLQFRAKMTEMLLNIMTTPISSPIPHKPMSSSSSIIPAMAMSGMRLSSTEQQKQQKQQMDTTQNIINPQQCRTRRQRLQGLQSELMDAEIDF